MRLGGVACAAAVVLAAGASVAAAAEPRMPPQIVGLHAEGLTRLPAKAPSAVCVVDTGVDLTPDTRRAVIARYNIVGGDDLGDASPTGHGTMVASAIAAPRNGWGTVGVWPAAKIVSVRVARDRSPRPPAFDDFLRGIRNCVALRVRGGLPITVINVSIDGPTAITEQQIADAVGRARAVEVSVVASGGNASGPLLFPSTTAGVVPVAAATVSGGSLCPSSSWAPGVLAAPGCRLLLSARDRESIRASGSSFAAPQIAAIIAAIRSRLPTLSADRAEALVHDASVPGPRGTRMVDASRALRRSIAA